MPLFAPNIDALKKRRKVRALIKLLENHHSPETRLSAAHALGEIGSQQAVDPLLHALNTTGDRLRLGIIVALARIGDTRAVQPLIDVLQGSDPKARPYAIRALAMLRATQAADALVEVRNTDPSNRKLAIQALVSLDDKRAVEPLAGHTAPPTEIRQATANALIDLGAAAIPALITALDTIRAPHMLIDVLAGIGAPAVQPLIRATRDSSYETQSAAISALERIGEPALGPLIDELDRNMGLSLRNAAAVQALGEMGDPRAVEPLSEALYTAHHTNRMFRREIAYALGKIGSDTALPAFRFALRDEDEDLRRAAVKGLSIYGHKPAVDLLLQAIQDHDPTVREEAVEALGDLGDITAQDPLARALKDTDQDVRRAAAEALGKIGSPQAIDVLTAALRDRSCEMRGQIAYIFSTIHNTRASRVLSTLIHDPNANIRRMALQARADQDGPAAQALLIAALQDIDADVRQVAAAALEALDWHPGQPEVEARYWIARQEWDKAVALGAAATAPLRRVLQDEAVRAQVSDALDTLSWLPKAQDEQAATFWIEQRQWAKCVAIGKPAVQPLLSMLDHSDPAVRQHAISALGDIGRPEAVKGVEQALDDFRQPLRVRLQAARTLAQVGGPAACRALSKTLQDRFAPNASERTRLDRALIKALSTCGPQAIPALVGAMDYPDYDARRAAEQAADALCTADAVPYLVQVLGDSQRRARQYAARALIALYQSGQLDAVAAQTILDLRSQITAPHADRGSNSPHDDAMRNVEGWCFAHVDEPAQTHSDTGIGIKFDL